LSRKRLSGKVTSGKRLLPSWALVSLDGVASSRMVCVSLLIFPCTIKSRSSLLAPAHPGDPGKRAVKRLWCGGWSIKNKLRIGADATTTPSSLPPVKPIIRAVVIVWRVRGKTIRSVLCNIVCNTCAQCDEQTNSSLDWVLSHWAHFTVLDSFLYYVLLCFVCMIA